MSDFSLRRQLVPHRASKVNARGPEIEGGAQHKRPPVGYSMLDTFVQNVGRSRPAQAGSPPGMPVMDTSKLTVTGGTAADVQAQLSFMWTNGGAAGQQYVTDVVNKVNSAGMRVGFSVPGVPGVAQGGWDSQGAFMNFAGPPGIPTAFNDQARMMMTMVHEFEHASNDGAYSGTTYGEARAYQKGYDFLKGLGLSNADIRNTLGAGDPTYILGTMQSEYGITISNAFLEMMRGIGVGSSGLRDVVAGSNTGATSSSPRDAAGDGLDKTELWNIAADIAAGVPPRHLTP
jgi:hypothetical protein